MARRPVAPRKSLSAANLSALGAERLADLLIEATAGDANLKRRLKLELAAEVGPADLAAEIDKRLAALAASRTRVSWRKRPELIADLRMHLRAILDRLVGLDPALALNSLVAWFDLYPGLLARVKDPKGELAALFFEAAAELPKAADALDLNTAVAGLAEPVETRLSDWGGWIGRAAPEMTPELAAALLRRLIDDRPRPSGRRALVVRKLADRAGDVDAWAASFPDEDQNRPDVGAAIALRLTQAGRASQAREALDRARPRAAASPLRSLRKGPPPPAERSEAWDRAEIAVLDAEGRGEEAQSARWAVFERTLDEAALRAFVARLADFDDVEATDRGLALAAAWPEPARGLAFLMGWPALREASILILTRGDDLKLSAEDTALWSSRLQARYPAAALLLVRARARALTRLGPGHAEEIRTLSMEALELAQSPGATDESPSHADFIDELERLAPTPARRLWR